METLISNGWSRILSCIHRSLILLRTLPCILTIFSTNPPTPSIRSASRSILPKRLFTLCICMSAESTPLYIGAITGLTNYTDGPSLGHETEGEVKQFSAFCFWGQGCDDHSNAILDPAPKTRLFSQRSHEQIALAERVRRH